MITTHTSPPGFRDGIEAAAKVARSYKTPSGIYHTLIQEGIAAAIRAIPTPDTLPTGWNSDIRYYVMSALNGFADLSPEDAIENARHDLNTLLRKLPPPPPGE